MVDVKQIPRELIQRSQWVLWRREKREGKWTKVPYTIHRQKASVDEPRTWNTFFAVYGALKPTGMDGIGYVFSADDPYTGIDLDNCRDPESGEVDGWAEALYTYLDSYSEISPSGAGIHVLVKGMLPMAGRRREMVEMYSSSRFFCMTGHRLPGLPSEIQERQEQLIDLFNSMFPEPEKPSVNGHAAAECINRDVSDEEIILWARNAKNGAKFAGLWEGRTDNYASASEADMALAALIAFWTGPDPERIDRIFRQSSLYRPKWGQKRGETTYGRRTIERVIEGKEDYYKPTDVQVLEEEEPEPAFVRLRTLEQVRKAFQSWLYLPDTGPLDVALATVIANKRTGQPVWLIQVAPGGFGKTETINPLSVLPYVHSVATLTEASLLSGTSRREKAKEAKGGLLREIGDFGIILCKDFGSILSLPRDPRAAVLAALREIFDGEWTRRVGTDGGQALEWKGKVGFIGACTPMIDHHHSVMAALGERFVFYRLPVDDEEKRTHKALGHRDLENQMRRELQDAVGGLFESIDWEQEPRELTIDEENRLVAISKLAAHARSAVIRDPYGREIELVPGSEAPTRLALTLARLLSGLETIGCTAEECWRLIGKIAMDSMPQLRRQAIEYLYATDMEMATGEVARKLGHPTQTVRRALEDLSCYAVVVRRSQGQGFPDEWHLADWARDHYHKTLGVPEKLEVDISF